MTRRKGALMLPGMLGGLAVGSLVGAATGQWALYGPLGLLVGLTLGMALDALRNRRGRDAA